MGNANGQAIVEKGRRFSAMVETFHATTVSDPLIAGNWFSIKLTHRRDDARPRPHEHERGICVYVVRDGRITREQFFFDFGE